MSATARSFSASLPNVPRNPIWRGIFLAVSRLANWAAERDGVTLDLLARVAAWRIERGMVLLGSGEGDAAPTLLAFSSERFGEDFSVLAGSRRFTIYAAPTGVLQALNALFPIRPASDRGRTYSYYLDEDPMRSAGRARLDRFVRRILTHLRVRVGLDGIISPTAHYEYQIPWAGASHAIGLPFIAIHKEFTVVPRHQLETRKANLRARGLKFPGTAVLVTNNRAIELFHDAGVIERSRMIVTGLPRMDRLYQKRSVPATRPKQVTLFSFGHYSGGLAARSQGGPRLFSGDPNYGFVELFSSVHGAMGTLALRYPDVLFTIKPKYLADGWISEIESAIEASCGKRMSEIRNCQIVETPALSLMEASDVVIAFNSTTLLESLILRRPTIVPLFAEASGRHSEYIYLKEELDLFYSATSKTDLEVSVSRVLDGGVLRDPPPNSRVNEVVKEYLGCADGSASKRVVEAILATIGSTRTSRPTHG